MTVLDHAQDRIAFAAEGAALAAGDALDFVRDRTAGVRRRPSSPPSPRWFLPAQPRRLGRRRSAAPSPPPRPPRRRSDLRGDERGFSLSLPGGWERARTHRRAPPSRPPRPTATPRRRSGSSGSPGSSFDAFVAQSTDSLDELGTDVAVTDRVGGPTLESQIAELSAEVALDGGAGAPYRVTCAPPARTATTWRPRCSRARPTDLLGDAELLSGSFRPGSLEEEVLGEDWHRPLVADHVGDRVDQRQVGEGLREVAEVAAGGGVELLGVEAERAAVLEQALAERRGRACARRSRAARRRARTSRSGRCPPRPRGRRRSRRCGSAGRGRSRSARRRSARTVSRTRSSPLRQEADERDQQVRRRRATSVS